MLVTWKNIVCFIDEEERAMTIVFVEVKKITQFTQHCKKK